VGFIKKRRFIKPLYRFFILLAGILVIIFLQILNCISQQKQIYLLDAEAARTVLVLEKLTEIQKNEKQLPAGELKTVLIEQTVDDFVEKMVLGKLAEIQEALEKMQKNEKQLSSGEIIGMLTEQMVNNYTESALDYFTEEDYANAARDFGRALRYQRGNTTLIFYQTYTLYLEQRNRALTESEFTGIQARIRELQEKGFREEEKIGFSVAEMEYKVREMGQNLGERE